MIVLDANAMIAYLAREEAGEAVRERLERPDVEACAHAVNLMEVFYDYARSEDTATARKMLARLEAEGIVRREDMDAAFCEDAGQIKADWRRVSLADCMGLALARRLDAEFITTDRHELEVIAAANVAKIVFV